MKRRNFLGALIASAMPVPALPVKAGIPWPKVLPAVLPPMVGVPNRVTGYEMPEGWRIHHTLTPRDMSYIIKHELLHAQMRRALGSSPAEQFALFSKLCDELGHLVPEPRRVKW